MAHDSTLCYCNCAAVMNFCVEDNSIELVVFWLDVEHFKHFDGNTDDMRLFAHHISNLLLEESAHPCIYGG